MNKKKDVLLVCDSSKKHYDESVKLLTDNGIKFDFLNVSEDKYYYPSISYDDIQWTGLNGLMDFITYYNECNIRWDKYIKNGNFVSSSGINLEYKWEFDKLDDNGNINDKKLILDSILLLSKLHKIIGITTLHPKELQMECSIIYNPKNNMIAKFGNFDNGDSYIIYDDVVTTGKTIINCIKKVKIIPKFCICIVDRRNVKKPLIYDNKHNINVFSIKDII